METVWTLLCGLVSGGATLLISYLSFWRQRRHDSHEAGAHRGVLLSDLGYIKSGVDDLKREIRETKQTLASLNERLTRCEESCKQAHRRLDEWRDTHR